MRKLLLTILLFIVMACGGGGGGGKGPFEVRGPTQDDFAISVTPTEVTLEAGKRTSVDLTFTNRRLDNLYVEVTVSGCPDSASCTTVETIRVEGTVTSRLSITTTTDTPAKRYSVSVRGSTSGVGANSASVSVILDVSPTMFSLSFSKTEYTGFAGSEGLALADFTSDGYLDAAVTSSTNETLSILEGGPGDMSLWAESHLSHPLGAVAVAELNGDQTPDILIAASSPTAMIVVSATPGGLTAPRIIELGDATFDYEPKDLVILDADQNNTNDLAIGAHCDALACRRGIGVWLGDGLGDFALDAGYSIDVQVLNLATGDINQDGRNDLLAIVDAPLTNDLILLEGKLNGQFASAKTIYSVPKSEFGSSPVGNIIIEDFNGDFVPDIAVSGAVILGMGDAAFADPQETEIVGRLAAGDINGDDMPDLISSSFSRMVVTLNLGGGVFDEPTYFSIGGGGAETLLADMNADGVLDVVVMGRNLLTVLLNDQ